MFLIFLFQKSHPQPDWHSHQPTASMQMLPLEPKRLQDD